METAIFFKILQRRYKYRNAENLTEIPTQFIYTKNEYTAARDYIGYLQRQGIKFTYPGSPSYPKAFLKMKEPPLFFEYLGSEVWHERAFVAVVGARQIHSLTELWLKVHFANFLQKHQVGVVSGGAVGVDQLAHLLAIKKLKKTIFILPSGLKTLYPKNLSDFLDLLNQSGDVCFISEFETEQRIHKSNFYFRNRLIAALGEFIFVPQADIKSGSMLTVHHGLELGKPIVVIPAHPMLNGFAGNLKLMQEGACFVNDEQDLHIFWKAESSSSLVLNTSP